MVGLAGGAGYSLLEGVARGKLGEKRRQERRDLELSRRVVHTFDATTTTKALSTFLLKARRIPSLVIETSCIPDSLQAPTSQHPAQTLPFLFSSSRSAAASSSSTTAPFDGLFPCC